MQTLSPLPKPAAPQTRASFTDRIVHGDSLRIMRAMPARCIDLIVTDPPYLVNYRDRSGRSIANDGRSDARWLYNTSREMYRLLKDNSFCISFYGWPKAGTFHHAWTKAGFRVVGNFVWAKPYASSTGYTQRRHECAALLAKGRPTQPKSPLPDVLTGRYSGNRLHPTQKPVELLAKFIRTYSKPGEIVLDPFAGSGSTAVAAQQLGRHYIAIELMEAYAKTAMARLTKPA